MRALLAHGSRYRIPPTCRQERDFCRRRQPRKKRLKEGNLAQRPKAHQTKSRIWPQKTAFLLADFNVRVSEVWVVEAADIELAAHHAVNETSLLLSQEREFSGQRRRAEIGLFAQNSRAENRVSQRIQRTCL